MAEATFRTFDAAQYAAQYLETGEEMAVYLDECAQDGDPAAIALALGAIARARNMSQLARTTDMTRAGLYTALSPGGNPSFATIVRIAATLGFRLGFHPAGDQAPQQDAAPSGP